MGFSSHRGLFFLFVFSFQVKRLLDICHFYNLCAESSLITLNVKCRWIKTEPRNVVFSTKRLASHWNVGWLSWLYYPRRVLSWLAEDISSSSMFLLRWRSDNKSIRLGQDESWSLLARNKIIHWFVPCRGAVLLLDICLFEALLISNGAQPPKTLNDRTTFVRGPLYGMKTHLKTFLPVSAASPQCWNAV